MLPVDKSIEQNLLQGEGFLGRKAGESIGSISLIKEGTADEFLPEGVGKLGIITISRLDGLIGGGGGRG